MLSLAAFFNIQVVHMINLYQLLPVLVRNTKQHTLEYPIILGNVTEEQPSGLCPRLINGVWKVAWSDAYTRSHNPRTVTAMPTAGPFTAAINGLEKSM